ncbi:MAG: O-antigen ligase family protein [Sphingopyxis granuli]
MANRRKGTRKFGALATSLVNAFRAFTGQVEDRAQSRVYRALLIYLGLVFLMGGAARYDVQSLIILRPFAVLACGFALWSLKIEHLRRYRFMAIMAVLIIMLAGMHLIPLPPAVWQSLPGRDLVMHVERAAGIETIWRPFTLTPTDGWNAFFSLFVPLAAFLMAIQLDAAHLRKLVLPLLLIGALSGLFGIVQAAGSSSSPFYLYRITNNGSAVGLFSNRNHQALFLVTMVPILAFFASQLVQTENAKKMRLAAAVGGLAMLVPLILVTGARQGIVLGVPALICGWLIYRTPQVVGMRRRTERKSYALAIAGACGTTLLVLLTVMASRAEALKRLVSTNVAEEGRAQAWDISARLAMDYLPFGSGSGSFVPVFQQAEPLDFLSPVYFNHVHNDFLEVLLTFGIPGMLLILAAVVAYGVAVRKIGRSDSAPLLAATGAAVILLFGLASFVDYPLRVPSMACFFVIACCWLRTGSLGRSISSGNRNGD